MQRRKFRRFAADLALSLAIGVATGFFLLVWTMSSSDWTRPAGVCDFVVGTGGLLPLNPNEGGTVYSCNPDLIQMLVHLLLPAPFFAGLAFILIKAIRWQPGRDSG